MSEKGTVEGFTVELREICRKYCSDEYGDLPVEATEQQLNAALDSDSILQNIYVAMIEAGKL